MVLRRAEEPTETEVLVEGVRSKLMEQMRICVRVSCCNKSSELLL